MARSFTGNAEILSKAYESQSLDLGAGVVPSEIKQTTSLTSGTGAGAVNEGWSDSRSLAVGSESLDLTALTQTDADGDTIRSAISFSKGKVVTIKNTSSSGYLIVGGGTGGAGAADAWAGTDSMLYSDASRLTVQAGGFISWYSPAGGAVANGTADILEIEAVVATQTYEILVTGEAT